MNTHPIPNRRLNARNPFARLLAGAILLGLIFSKTLKEPASAAEAQNSRPTQLALPTARQAAWHDFEVGTFIHFGPTTYLDWVIDWPTQEYRSKEVSEHQLPDKPSHQFDPKRFNPAQLDTDQWVAAAEAMGSKYMVMVAKHHGGFCVWQTGTSEYSVRNTPWRQGKGDILADLSESCRKRGMHLGLYLSPQDHVHGAGPGGRCRNNADQEHYNRVYRQQLTEILTRYGRITEVWFDGGLVVPVDDILRQHAAEAVIFQGPQASIRWVGNEEGFAPYPCWNSVSEEDGKSGVATAARGTPTGSAWLPCECDTTIRGQWHWASDKTPWGSASLKSLQKLLETYYRSVGHGQVLLLNHSPDPSGRITAADFRRGAELGSEIQRRFGRSVAETTGRGTTLELAFAREEFIDHVVTMEDIAHGERVRDYTVEGFRDGNWIQLCSGSAIGHKKIDRFPAAKVSAIRLSVKSAALTPVIRKFAAYHTGNPPESSQPTSPQAGKSIDIVLPSAADTVEWVDLSSRVHGPGQYVLHLKEPGGKLIQPASAQLFIDGIETPEYLKSASGKPGTLDLNITVTRSWPAGSLTLKLRSQP